MAILIVLIPLSLALIGLAVWAFVWAVNHDQFEDLDIAAQSILYDDDPPPRKSSDADAEAREKEVSS